MVGKLSPLDRKLLRDFWRMKGQLLAIALIVACGVMMMILSLGSMNSLRESQYAYYEQYRFADVFANLRRGPASLASEIKQIEGVREVYPQIVAEATLDLPRVAEPSFGQLVSLPDDGPPLLNDLILLDGRMPAPGSPLEVLANHAFMNAHGYELETTIQATLNGTRQPLIIVGIAASPEYVYTLPPGGIVPDDKRFGIFWTPIDNLETVYDLEGAINALSLSLYRDADARDVIEEVDHLIDPYGGAGAYEREDQFSHAFIEAELDQLETMARVLPPIFLIIAAALLNVIMTRLIDTEREAVGLLKAFGYTDREVAAHYVKLALLVAAIGIVLGYIAGTWLGRNLTALYAEFFHFPFFVYRESRMALILASSFSLLSAAVGAMNAIWKAAVLAPAEAMQREPPTVYKSSLWEGLGASRLLDKPSQMMIRHIFRWPGRSLATALGIAAAQGLLIGTLFSYDAVDRIVELYFTRGAPHDVAVSFTEALPASELRRLQTLPGVVATEPVRDLGVELRHGYLEDTVSVSGIDPTTQMRKVFDSELRQMTVPPHGLLISEPLARKLNVRPGEAIEMEVLSGRQPVVTAHIAGLVRDHVGLPVYADRRYLNAIMGEGELVTGVYIRLSAEFLDAFYEEIKLIPGVRAVTLQSVAYTSFQETLAESITIMMNVYRAVGALIAIGVIYNAARIALAERARELASLHILGFSEREVSYVLIGELVFLTFLALPIGCMFGYTLAWFIATAMATDIFRLPLLINASTYGGAMMVTLTAMVISCIIVWRQIVGLDMIETLKSRD